MLRRSGQINLAAVIVAALLGGAGGARAQDTASSPLPVPDGHVLLQVGDTIEVQALVDLLSRHLGVNVLYDEQIQGKPVTLRTPTSIPKTSLLPLVNSALQMKGLMLVDDAGGPGWKRVVPSGSLLATTPPVVGRGEEASDAPAVTRVFELQHASPQKVDEVVRPFLSQPGGNSVALTDAP